MLFSLSCVVSCRAVSYRRPRPQLTWYLSSLNRITGVALSGLLYAGALTFLLHPVFPAIDSAHLIELVSSEYRTIARGG
jgi:succinate dehydrogenase/fumarate reductase cytochrome b subunit